MNSRDIVKQTLDFTHRGRVPRDAWISPWAQVHHPDAVAALRRDFPADIVDAPASLREAPVRTGDMYAPGRYTDEWGCVFENIQKGVHGEVKVPIIRDWGDLTRVRFPRELLSVDIDRVNDFCRGSDRFVKGGCCPRPFERLQFLRGTEDVYCDLAEGDPGMLDFLRRIHAFNCEELTLWARTDVDGLMIMDDWGSQQALLISPELWRSMWKPLYRDYAEIAHRHGKYLFMHSDGFIADIIEDLIEVGVDALNSQVFCMGLENLASFRGRITFWGEIDRQHILPSPEISRVTGAVNRFHEALYQDGGVIAQCEFGPGARPEAVTAVFQTWNTLSGAA